jgi:hypothetical protein
MARRDKSINLTPQIEHHPSSKLNEIDHLSLISPSPERNVPKNPKPCGMFSLGTFSLGTKGPPNTSPNLDLSLIPKISFDGTRNAQSDGHTDVTSHLRIREDSV